MEHRTIDFSTFLSHKDSIQWHRLSQWVRGAGAVQHLVWKGFMVRDGKVVDIPMYFAYVSVDSNTGRASLSLSANVKFDPQGRGQQVIDSVPLGRSEDINDSLIKEIMSSRYGMAEIDFSKTPVGHEHSPLAKNAIMITRMVNQQNRTIANIYLYKLEYSGKKEYRTETMIVDMESGLTSTDESQRKRESVADVRDAAAQFRQTVRHLASVGYVESPSLPQMANESNWDFELNLPKDVADNMRQMMEATTAKDQEESRERLDALMQTGDDDVFASSGHEHIRTAQGLSQWVQAPLPDPRQLQQFVGTSGVEASQLRSVFGGVDDAIRMVNEFDSSLLLNVAFIFNFSSGGEYGVYVSALDEKIKREAVKQELRSAGFQIQESPDGMAFSASHPEKTPEETQKMLDDCYQRVGSKGATAFGVNMNKVVSSAAADAAQLGISKPEEIADLVKIRLGETMVHEAVHSKGEHSEGPAEAYDSKFVQWALGRLNKARMERMKSEGREQEYTPLIMDAGRRQAGCETWLESAARMVKKSQFGAQFVGLLRHDTPAFPWSVLPHDSNVAIIESMLDLSRNPGVSLANASTEKRMRDAEKDKWDNSVDTDELHESLLEKDRQPLESYRHTEKLLEDRRDKPLMVPVRKSENSGMIRTAYSGEGGSAFGWTNNLNLPMNERMWTGEDEDGENVGTWMDWRMIRKLPRYNPEYGDPFSKFKDVYYAWLDPRLAPELWDKMIQERPCFMTSPARRFASQKTTRMMTVQAQSHMPIVHNVAELVAAVYSGSTWIVIDSSPYTEMLLDREITYEVHGNSRVLATGFSKVRAYDSSIVTAHDRSNVWAYGSSQVDAHDFSQVETYDNSHMNDFRSGASASQAAEPEKKAPKKDAEHPPVPVRFDAPEEIFFDEDDVFSSSRSPNRTAQKSASTDDLSKVGGILYAAAAAISKGEIRGTRFVATHDIVSHLVRFYEDNPDIRVVRFKLGQNTESVWVVKNDIPQKNAVEMAEEFASGRSGGKEYEEMFDYITGMSAGRKRTIMKILSAVKDAAGKSTKMRVVGALPRAMIMGDPWSHVAALSFACDDPDACLKIGTAAAEIAGLPLSAIEYDSSSVSWELFGLKCEFLSQSPKDAARLLPLSCDQIAYAVEDGKLYDLSDDGHGISDARARVARARSDPKAVFKRNPFGILRTIRSAVKYGMEIDPETSKAMLECANSLFDGSISDGRLALAYVEIMSEGKEKASEILEYYKVKDDLKRRFDDADAD